ncbi:MAG TPA: hypothetical protein VM118_07955 [Acidobacteriota bacterium]|nr:hypothetical protein [Acidobacteriota bacterium]
MPRGGLIGRWNSGGRWTTRWIGCAAAVAAVLTLTAIATALSAEPAVEAPSQVELLAVFGRSTVWMGDRIRYTVYERTRVEARINGMAGDLLTLLRIGEQEPGQYTLPWDGTFHGAPFAGRYEFELFFDVEYAAHFWFLCRPKEPSS